MFKMKLFSGLLLVLAVLFAQVGIAFAAPAAQDTTMITGTFVSLTPDPTTQTVLVTYTDANGLPQTVNLSYTTAVGLGLITVDSVTQAVTVVAQPGAVLTVDPTTVIPAEEEDVHPIAAILAKFFDMQAGAVNDLHEDGFGFGVIAQALWMQKNLDDAEITAEMILQAKKNKDFSSITLSDGTNPTNWGQFKKALLDKKNNLGVIVSGHADNDTEDSLTQQNPGQGKDKVKNQGKGKGNGKKP